MWELYDELIEKIPDNIIVEEIIYGPHWVMVRSGEKFGVAMNTSGNTVSPMMRDNPIGKSLKEIASTIKSFNLSEASMGAAALNFYYNEHNKVKDIIKKEKEINFLDNKDTFVAYEEKVKGKKVAIIGHFRNLSNFINKPKEIYILERDPQEGDYPDSACEYILPLMDYVFITGSTLINKTLPRLLELSKNSNVILVGPTTPLTPILFRYGVNELSGVILKDVVRCSEIIKEIECAPLIETGMPIRMEKYKEDNNEK